MSPELLSEWGTNFSPKHWKLLNQKGLAIESAGHSPFALISSHGTAAAS